MGDAYLRGDSEVPQGVQVTSSFVASQDDTNVAIQFSAEAFVDDDNPGAGRRMFVRALVDGAVVAPSDVVFAKTGHEGTQSFIFTTNVPAGIHTVEIQWKMDGEATGYIRDASLLVRMGRDDQSAKGTFTTKTAPSGMNQTTNVNGWTDIPGMSASIYSPKNGQVTASFSAEAFVSKGKRFALRAVIDGAPMTPGDVIFVNANPSASSQAMTFGIKNVAAGWHTVKFQWLVDAGGTATVGDRSLAISALPVRTDGGSHQFLAANSGANVETPKEVSTPVELPGMSLKFDIPATGNGEVAVQFSAEADATGDASAFAGLAIDGDIINDTWVKLADGSQSTHIKSYVFEAKGLAPGSHTATIYFGSSSDNGQAIIGDRTMNLISATGFIPDLAETPVFGGGHIGKDSDHIAGIEPLIGSRPVLTVLIDPGLCQGTYDQVAQQMCYNQFTVAKGKADQAVFGTSAEPGWGAFNGNNVKSYLETNSGGLFTIERAGPGIAGWYSADKPSDAYYKHDGSCTDGFDEGGLMLIAEAVKKSNPDVNFASFDKDGDGVLNQQELGILVVIPRSTGGAGSSIQPLLASNCDGPDTRMTLDGVVLPQHVAKWNANFDATVQANQFMTGVHEYLHLVGGTDDLYLDVDVSTFPRDMTVMSNGDNSTTHLDPLYKLAFGWVTPVIVDESKQVTVSAVAKSNTVFILPRYNNPWAEEFFVLENRKEGMGLPWFDEDINDSGIAVWHIVSDRVENQEAPIGTAQALWDDSHIPDDNPTSLGQMGRNGIRLIRPFDDIADDGNAIFNDKSHTLWTKDDYILESGDCLLVVPTGEAFKNRLTWADCEASGYSLSFLDFAIENANVAIKVQ